MILALMMRKYGPNLSALRNPVWQKYDRTEQKEESIKELSTEAYI